MTYINLGGYSGPTLTLPPGNHDITEFLKRHRHEDNVTIAGAGPNATKITHPVHLFGSVPELRDLTVSLVEEPGPVPLIEGEAAVVALVNPISSSLRNVQIQHAQQGTWALMEVISPMADPDKKSENPIWPWRGKENNLTAARSSLSMARDLRLVFKNGGGLKLKNAVTPAQKTAWSNAGLYSSFSNHWAWDGGTCQNVTKWGDVKGWWTGGEFGNADWDERFSPMPSFDVEGHELQLTNVHADVFPHMGVRLNSVPGSRGRLGWLGRRWLEPTINARRWASKPDWNTEGTEIPPWVVEGNEVGTPNLENRLNACEGHAGEFVIRGWRAYMANEPWIFKTYHEQVAARQMFDR